MIVGSASRGFGRPWGKKDWRTGQFSNSGVREWTNKGEVGTKANLMEMKKIEQKRRYKIEEKALPLATKRRFQEEQF